MIGCVGPSRLVAGDFRLFERTDSRRNHAAGASRIALGEPAEPRPFGGFPADEGRRPFAPALLAMTPDTASPAAAVSAEGRVPADGTVAAPERPGSPQGGKAAGPGPRTAPVSTPAAVRSFDRLLEPLWDDTRRRLSAPPLRLSDRPLPPDIAEFSGPGGKTRIRAASWLVHSVADAGEAEVADCRIVVITGTNAEIVNTMIFPARPEAMPVFAAELLVFGGVPRLAFVDLQVPGLAAGSRAALGGRLKAVASGYAHLPCDQTAPDWAVEYSTGGYVFTRPNDTAFRDDLLRLYREYLDIWAGLAGPASSAAPAGPASHGGRDERNLGNDARPGAEAAAELERYKRQHVAHSPGKVFLEKMFGAGWTDRFLNGFLYS
jgi:hypothetical protein